MKLIQITESADSLSMDDIEAMIKGDYSEAYKEYKEGTVIYRGIHVNIPFLLQEPKPERKAANTHYNFHNLIFRQGDWPKRSTIMSMNKEYASVYGSLYVCLPKNGANIGICSGQDIWDSFPAIESALPDADSSFQHLITFVYNALDVTINYIERLDSVPNETKAKIKSIKNNNTDDAYKILRIIDDVVENMQSDQKHNLFQADDVLYTIYGDDDEEDENGNHGYGGFYNFIQEVITTEGFEVSSIADLGDEVGEYNEVWTDSPVLMISERALSSIDDNHVSAINAYKIFLRELEDHLDDNFDNVSKIKYDKVDSLDRGDKVNIKFRLENKDCHMVIEFLKDSPKKNLKFKAAEVTVDGETHNFTWKDFYSVFEFLDEKFNV